MSEFWESVDEQWEELHPSITQQVLEEFAEQQADFSRYVDEQVLFEGGFQPDN